MSASYPTTSFENARVVVPCRTCGNPVIADGGMLTCPACAAKRRVVYANKRRAREQGNGGTHSVADIQARYDYQKGRCFYCGATVGDKYHVDHFMPLALGGSNGPENLVIACPACNLAKSAVHPIVFCVGLDLEKAL